MKTATTAPDAVTTASATTTTSPTTLASWLAGPSGRPRRLRRRVGRTNCDADAGGHADRTPLLSGIPTLTLTAPTLPTLTLTVPTLVPAIPTLTPTVVSSARLFVRAPARTPQGRK